MQLNMSLITITDELFKLVDNNCVPVHASRLLRCFFLQTFLIFFMLSKITPKENNLSWPSIKLWEDKMYTSGPTFSWSLSDS